jgi:hypothetical protein
MAFNVNDSVYDVLFQQWGVVISASSTTSTMISVQYTDANGKSFAITYTPDGKLSAAHTVPVLYLTEAAISQIAKSYKWVVYYTDSNGNKQYVITTNYFKDSINESTRSLTDHAYTGKVDIMTLDTGVQEQVTFVDRIEDSLLVTRL